MYLATNVLVETIGDGESVQIERVLHVDRPGDTLVVVDVENERVVPRWMSFCEVQADLDEGRKRLLRHDPWLSKPKSDDTLTEAEKAGRNRAWSIIEPVVVAGPEKMFDPVARGRAIARIVERGLASKPTVYKYLYRYWRGGQSIHALIPRYGRSGGPGKTRTDGAVGRAKRGRPSFVQKATGHKTGINVDESVRRRLVNMGTEFYENKGLTLKGSYLEGLAKYFHDGYEVLPDGTRFPVLPPPESLPTFGQYMYWYSKARNPDEVKLRREGRRAYNLKHRALHGDSTSVASGPGSVYQIDATTGDVYLVSSRDPRLIIGRPVIYVVADTFSRLVVGFTVGLEGPSWMGAVLAFENVATDKVEFCASMGINVFPEDWPVQHLPEAVLADRGELKGFNADTLAKAFGVRVANTPPYRPDWKPIVESRFSLMDRRVVHNLPGAVRKTERGDRDYRLDAVMTLGQLRKVLALCFLEHNENNLIKDYPLDPDMRRDDVRPYPLELWRWGLRRRSGGLRYFPREVVRRQLLPRAKATVTQRGLLYKRHYYTCELVEAERWGGRARQNGTWRVDIAYDPWSSGRIWMEIEDQKDLLVCEEIPGPRTTGDVPWAELEAEAELDELNSRREEGARLQTQVRYNAQIGQVLDEAEARAASVAPADSRAERLRGITGNRRDEKLLERRISGLQGTDGTDEPETPDESDVCDQGIPMFDPSVSSGLDAVMDGPEGGRVGE